MRYSFCCRVRMGPTGWGPSEFVIAPEEHLEATRVSAPFLNFGILSKKGQGYLYEWDQLGPSEIVIAPEERLGATKVSVYF